MSHPLPHLRAVPADFGARCSALLRAVSRQASPRPLLCLLCLFFLALPIRSGSLATGQDIEAGDPLETVYYEPAALLGTACQVPRPPEQVANGLRALLQTSPGHHEYLKLLAGQEALMMRFQEAEQHLLEFVKAAGNTPDALGELAAFYASRHLPVQQVRALESAAAESVKTTRAGTPLSRHPAYQRYQEILAVIDAQRPEGIDKAQYLKKLSALFPEDMGVSKLLHQQLRADRRVNELRTELAAFRASHPDQTSYALGLESDVLVMEGREDQAIQMLNGRYQPLWPADLVAKFYGLLQQDRTRWLAYTRGLERQLDQNPKDLDAATRLFFCYQQDGNVEFAVRVLRDLRRFKEGLEDQTPAPAAGWQASELYVMAGLFKRLADFNEAARHYYALYELLGAPGYRESKNPWPELQTKLNREEALYQIFDCLLLSVGKPTQIGAGSLQYYRRIAELDSHPGALNAILSVLLNRTDPGDEYRRQEDKAATYFNTRKAEELYRLFGGQFPKSGYRPQMAYFLLQNYAGYGEHDAVVRAGQAALEQYPSAAEYLAIGLLVADSQQALGRKEASWKTYDALLVQAAQRSRGSLIERPAESAAPATPEGRPEGGQENSGAEAPSAGAEQPSHGELKARPAEVTYRQVLSRYISSLTQAREVNRALALYRREIEAHPNEAGLYEILAQFLEQNRIFDEVEKVYQSAIRQFKDRSWYDRLARWYLRRRMNAQYAQLSQQVAEVFRGSEIAEYIQNIVSSSPASNAIYLQVNLFAHQRFPHHLAFVHNLMNYYRQPRTANPAEWEVLARRYFFLSPTAQRELVIQLSRQKRIDSTLTAIRGSDSTLPEDLLKRLNPAEVRLLAEGLVWRSQFESAAPLIRSLAAIHPDIRDLGETDAVLHRSLGSANPENYARSLQTRERLALLYPLETEQLVKAGETLVDAGRLEAAVGIWKRIPTLLPGKSDAYIEAATVFWDYFQYPEAMDQIRRYRQISTSPHALSYEAGAIYESRGQLESAVGEYFASLLPAAEPDYASRGRLRQLLERPEARELILSRGLESIRAAEGKELLPAYLEFLSQNRQAEAIAAVLEARQGEVLREPVWSVARRVLRNQGLTGLEEQYLNARIRQAADPLDQAVSQADLADFLVRNRKLDQAAAVWERLLRQFPRNIGVIENSVRFFWRYGSRPRAVAILNAAVPGSNRQYSRRFLQDQARYQLELKDFPGSEQALLQLLQLEPLSSEYSNQLSQLYARWNKPDLLRQHYETVLKRLQDDTTLGKDEKTERIVNVRLGLVEANTTLGRFSEAVDQHIEILNRKSEDAVMTAKAAVFAEEHGLEQKLLSFFSNQAAQSNKDYRWPWLLARINRRLGNSDDSLAYYAKAATIQPDRVELLQEQADMQVRIGKTDDAVASYQRLFRQTYRSSRWLYAAAALRAGQDRLKEALVLTQEALDADSVPPARRGLHLALQLESWNRPREAYDAAEQFLQAFSRNPADFELLQPGLAAYLEAAVRLGKTVEAWNRMMVLLRALDMNEDAHRYSTQMAIQEALPRAIREFASASELSAIETAISSSFVESEKLPRESWQEMALSLSRSARMPFLEERMLKDALEQAYAAIQNLNDESWNRYRQLCSQLERFYRTRHAYAELAQWQESEWRRNRFRTTLPEDLIEVADSYRMTGQGEDEIRILKEYLLQPLISSPARSSATHRLVETLTARERDQDLDLAALAANPGPDALAVTNALIVAGKPVLAAQALRAAPNSRPAWLQAQELLIAAFSGDAQSGLESKAQQLLRLGSIGQTLASPPDRQQQLIGEEWFFTANRYGTYLARQRQEARAAADSFLAADLEAHPKDTDAQMRTGDSYLELGDPATALEYYRQAVHLQPLSYGYRTRLAAGLYANQRRDEAIAEWKAVLERQISPASAPSARRLDIRVRHVRTVVEAAVAHDFFGSTQEALQNFVAEVIRLQGHYSIADLLELLISRTGGPSRAALLQQWITGASDPLGMADFLLDVHSLSPPEKERVFEHAASRLAATQARESSEGAGEREAGSLWRLKFHYAEMLLDSRAFDRCRELLRELEPDREDWTPEMRRWGLLKARLELKAGNLGPAILVLEELDRRSLSSEDPAATFSESVALLKAEGAAAAAAELARRHYQAILAGGSTERALFLAAAQAWYEKQESAKARKMLDQMLFSSETPEWPSRQGYLDRFSGVAPPEPLLSRAGRLAEEFGDWAAARQFRTATAGAPLSGPAAVADNRLALARIETQHGGLAQGLQQLGSLLADSGSPVQARREAAQFAGSLLQQPTASAVRVWLASPAGISAIKDPELAEYLGGLAQGAAGEGSGELSTHTQALKQLPYALLPPERLFALRDRNEAAPQVSAAILRTLFLDPESMPRRPEYFRWFIGRGQPRMALAVLSQTGVDTYGSYWRGRQLASKPLEESDWTRDGPFGIFALSPQSAFEMAVAASGAATSAGLPDKAEYYARWATYLAPDDASRSGAVDRLQQLTRQHKDQEQQRSKRYRVEPTIAWPRELNP